MPAAAGANVNCANSGPFWLTQLWLPAMLSGELVITPVGALPLTIAIDTGVTPNRKLPCNSTLKLVGLSWYVQTCTLVLADSVVVAKLPV